jgi:beta-ureidopropionase / N-carbamoyl-L-amino-acid hydrolase
MLAVEFNKLGSGPPSSVTGRVGREGGAEAVIAVNPNRLLRDLREVAEFGRYRSGVHRPTFSPQDMQARRWLADRMSEAGLQPSIDGVGNVIGRSTAHDKCLLIGSHSETQNHAGWLDGILGVIYGIEVVRALREMPGGPAIGVDVGSWADEEGHFLQLLGSRSFCDDLSEEEIEQAVNGDDKTPLHEALSRAGLQGRERERIDRSRYLGYLEAHIEQGDYLDSSGLSIGVVTSIVGLWQYEVIFDGQANHAGTTRMARRRDAGLALSALRMRIENAFKKIARPHSVWTVGRIELEPGAPSIIPGKARMLFQFRDDDPAQLKRFEELLVLLADEANADSSCRCTVRSLQKVMPTTMTDSLLAAIEAAAEELCPSRCMRMPSGAIHDAQIFAKIMPSAMMFVPSIGGISHHYLEDTSEDDIVLGCEVFSRAVARIVNDPSAIDVAHPQASLSVSR